MCGGANSFLGRRLSGLTGAVLAVGSAFSTAAQADVLTFEDLGGVLGFFTVPYKGFSFGTNDANTNPWFYTRQVSPYYKPKSGVRYVATDYQLYDLQPLERTAPITSATDFVFDGAWFTGGATVQFELYRDGRLVHRSVESPELSAVPLYLPSGYSGLVDSVIVLGTQGYYAMDDFTFNSRPIPEASTGAMLGGGLVLLAFAFLRRSASRGAPHQS